MCQNILYLSGDPVPSNCMNCYLNNSSIYRLFFLIWKGTNLTYFDLKVQSEIDFYYSKTVFVFLMKTGVLIFAYFFQDDIGDVQALKHLPSQLAELMNVIGTRFLFTAFSPVLCSVGDPDPQEPHVFGPPGSVCQRYGSGSGSRSFPFA